MWWACGRVSGVGISYRVTLDPVAAALPVGNCRCVIFSTREANLGTATYLVLRSMPSRVGRCAFEPRHE
jgi:hypothetical protein